MHLRVLGADISVCIMLDAEIDKLVRGGVLLPPVHPCWTLNKVEPFYFSFLTNLDTVVASLGFLIIN